MKLACQDKLQLIIKLELNQLNADITTSPDGWGVWLLGIPGAGGNKMKANSAQHI